MYLQILKKDLKRKKTMNVILLIFVILAATFIASSANNLITISSAMNRFFEKANVPDYWFASTNAADIETFEEFAENNGYEYHISRLIQIEPKNILVDGKKLEYSNTACLSTLGETIRISQSGVEKEFTIFKNYYKVNISSMPKPLS